MGKDNTSLGDRMKWYESRYTNDQFMPMVPVVARMDGRSFHTFTRGLKRPYDERLSRLMVETTKLLVQETNARCGYTQSDEITLVWLAEEWESDIFFAGKLQKMNSLLGAMTSNFFNMLLPRHLPEKAKNIADWLAKPEGSPPVPAFDCRVFQVPTDFEATNCFIWREKDATRNSVQMAAQANFSHNECQNKNSSELQDMLWHEKGINWNDYPAFFKRGTYVRRRTVERAFTAEELDALPPKHAARLDASLKIRRSSVVEETFPPMTRVANREDVILHGADPVERKDEDVDL